MPDQDPRTHAIIGAAMAVHTELGCGFLEAVYQEALAYELHDRDIPHDREAAIRIHYRERELAIPYRVDFLCYSDILVELKAVKRLSTIEEAQTLNYLKASKANTALLLNFGEPSLTVRRFKN